ncbi:MAG: DUF3990 domain-containing protein [Lachnospiraceae bacterium]|nr:DUF3990 domain-containing protein [Lachnospiraceae bacterium]
MILYHTGFEIIKEPDIHHGRKNADFGQGFYLTDDEAFAHRWARERKGEETVVNTYELDTEGLAVKRFKRDESWFEYIYGNRNHKPDPITADVIMGPIANDTIYDTFGVMTSGMLPKEIAMDLLLMGPEYLQITLKTEVAAKNLRWLSSVSLSSEEVREYRKTVISEQEEYQKLFVKKLAGFGGTQ